MKRSLSLTMLLIAAHAFGACDEALYQSNIDSMNASFAAGGMQLVFVREDFTVDDDGNHLEWKDRLESMDLSAAGERDDRVLRSLGTAFQVLAEAAGDHRWAGYVDDHTSGTLWLALDGGELVEVATGVGPAALAPRADGSMVALAEAPGGKLRLLDVGPDLVVRSDVVLAENAFDNRDTFDVTLVGADLVAVWRDRPDGALQVYRGSPDGTGTTTRSTEVEACIHCRVYLRDNAGELTILTEDLGRPVLIVGSQAPMPLEESVGIHGAVLALPASGPALAASTRRESGRDVVVLWRNDGTGWRSVPLGVVAEGSFFSANGQRAIVGWDGEQIHVVWPERQHQVGFNRESFRHVTLSAELVPLSDELHMLRPLKLF